MSGKLRSLGLPLLLGFAFIVAVILIFSGVSLLPSRPQPEASATPPPSPTAGTVEPAASPTRQTPVGQLAASVNGRDISAELWRETNLLDRAMNELTGQPAPSEEETLDGLINEVLILQAAGLEGAQVSDEDAEKQIVALENKWKIGDEQVAAALRKVGLERPALVKRTGRLLLVSQGMSVIAAKRGDAQLWLTLAWREAQISLYNPPELPPVSEVSGPVTVTPTAQITLPVAPQEGALAPDFTLSDLQGNQVSLGSLRGKPVMINFWTTWCPSCRAELPALVSAYSLYHEKGLEILAVDVKEDRQTVASFAGDSGLTFPILLDEGGTLAEMYQVRGTPTTLFVGPDGVVTARHLGTLSLETLEGYLAPLLKQSAR